MIPVKICGITNKKDAEAAVNYGASAIGFIFYDKSPRYILPAKACKIAKDLKGQVSFIGVFVDETLDYVHTTADNVGLNIIQLHGNESSEYSHKVQLPVIKVFRVSPNFDTGILSGYDVHAFLFDSFKKNTLGGTGEAFDWNLIIDLETDKPIILSGGLGINNIEDSIEMLLPAALDINSSVESKPGVKDEKKMKELFNFLSYTENTDNPFKVVTMRKSSHEL